MRAGTDFIGVGVVYFCHDGKGSVFMSKRGQNARDERGRWDIGGGAMDFGSSVEETLRREIKEEYASDIKEIEYLGYRDVHREHEGKPTHWIVLDFKVLIDPTQAKNNEPHKFDDAQWFKLSELPNPVHSQLPIFIKKYEEKLRK